jgi:hypothetical protein
LEEVKLKTFRSTLTSHKIAAFCDQRLKDIFMQGEVDALQSYLCSLLERHEFPPYRGTRLDVQEVARVLHMDATCLSAARSVIQPVFDAVARAVASAQLHAGSKRGRARKYAKLTTVGVLSVPKSSKVPGAQRPESGRRGPSPRSVVAFPEPLQTA